MQIYLTLLLCILSQAIHAQDERFFREMYTGELANSQKKPFDYKIEVSSDKYEIDLNRDNKKDSIQSIKKDGVDFFRINDEYGKTVFEAKLETKGFESKIFRASFKTISKDIDVLLLHFYEGYTKTASFEGSARLYVVTIKKRSLKDITLTTGPYFWTEKEQVAGKYWARRYSVQTDDLNKDGKKEIIVNFNNINKILYYSDKGIWKSF